MSNLFGVQRLGVGTHDPQGMLDVRGDVRVAGNIVPLSNEIYDLGASNARFRDLFLSGNTIDMAGLLLTKNTGGSLEVRDRSTNSLQRLVVDEIQIGTSNSFVSIGKGQDNRVKIQRFETTVAEEPALPVEDAGAFVPNLFALNSNIGIGTSNPSARLDVNGDARIVGQTTVYGHILPASNIVYDLGSSNLRFRDLYLSGNTINIGSNTIGVNEQGQIDVGSNLYAENFIGLNVNCSNVLAHSATFTNLNVPGTLNAVLDTNTVQIGTNQAQFVNIGTSTLTQTINIGTGSGATTINLGGAGDTVNIAGTLTTVNTTNTTVSDNRITLNKGGAAGTGGAAGFTIEEAEYQAGEVLVTDDRLGWKLKAPATAGAINLYPGASGFNISASNMWTAQSSNVVRATGGVAIGKATAAYPLDVVGDARIAGTATIIGDINFTGQLRSNGQLVSLGGGGGGGSNATGADNYTYKILSSNLSYNLTTTDTFLEDFTITLTPTSSNGEIELSYMINGEANENVVFQLYRNGSKIGTHATNNGQMWAGTAPVPYDGNVSSTLNQIIIHYIDSPATTGPCTYKLAAKTTYGTYATTLFINRTVSSTGSEANENAITTIFARQLGGAITVAQAFQYSNNIAFLPAGSNLGIGKPNAAYALDVVGDVNITGNFKVNGSNLSMAGLSNVSTIAGGTVLQTQTVTTDSQPFYDGSTWQDIPSYSVSITPRKSNSKIVLIGTLNIGGNTGDSRWGSLRLRRNGTDVRNGAPVGNGNVCFAPAQLWPSNYGYVVQAIPIHYVDTVNSTATQTYTIAWNPNPTGGNSRGYYMNRCHFSGDDLYRPIPVSTLTIMEIDPDNSLGANATGADNYVYKNVNNSLLYTVTNTDTVLNEFTMTVTPTSVNAEIELSYMINCESDTNVVYQLYRNGVRIGNHATDAGQIWSGTAPTPYDNDTNSTMSQVVIHYVDTPQSTQPITYTIAAKATNAGASYTLAINRTFGRAGESYYENTVSTAFARQLGGAITLAQAFQTSNNLVFLPNGSNLAIGKSNAAYSLDVVGDVNITGNFKVNGSNLSLAGSTSNLSMSSGSSTLVFPLLTAGSYQATGRYNNADYYSNRVLPSASELQGWSIDGQWYTAGGANQINEQVADFITFHLKQASVGTRFEALVWTGGGNSNGKSMYAMKISATQFHIWGFDETSTRTMNFTNITVFADVLLAVPSNVIRREYVRSGFQPASSYAVCYTNLLANDNMSGYIAYTSDTTNGDSFTVLQGGVYSIVAQFANSGASSTHWIDRNMAYNVQYQLGSTGNVLAMSSKGGNSENCASYVGLLSANDVVRAKVFGGTSVAQSWMTLRVTYLGQGGSQFNTTAGSNVFLPSGSNLGIGKSNAAFALDVVGDINFTGQLRSNGVPYAPVSLAAASNGLTLSGQQIGLALATSTTPGALSAADKGRLDTLYPAFSEWSLNSSFTQAVGWNNIPSMSSQRRTLNLSPNGVPLSPEYNGTYEITIHFGPYTGNDDWMAVRLVSSGSGTPASGTVVGSSHKRGKLGNYDQLGLSFTFLANLVSTSGGYVIQFYRHSSSVSFNVDSVLTDIPNVLLTFKRIGPIS